MYSEGVNIYATYVYIYTPICNKDITSGLNAIFLSPDILSGRNDVIPDKVNFNPGIRQCFFWKKIRTSIVCAATETIWSYCTLINFKLSNLVRTCSAASSRTSVVFKEHFTGCFYVFSIYFESEPTAYHKLFRNKSPCEKKNYNNMQTRVKQIITKEYKERFVYNHVEASCFTQA